MKQSPIISASAHNNKYLIIHLVSWKCLKLWIYEKDPKADSKKLAYKASLEDLWVNSIVSGVMVNVLVAGRFSTFPVSLFVQ